MVVTAENDATATGQPPLDDLYDANRETMFHGTDKPNPGDPALHAVSSELATGPTRQWDQTTANAVSKGVDPNAFNQNLAGVMGAIMPDPYKPYQARPAGQLGQSVFGTVDGAPVAQSGGARFASPYQQAMIGLAGAAAAARNNINSNADGRQAALTQHLLNRGLGGTTTMIPAMGHVEQSRLGAMQALSGMVGSREARANGLPGSPTSQWLGRGGGGMGGSREAIANGLPGSPTSQRLGGEADLRTQRQMALRQLDAQIRGGREDERNGHMAEWISAHNPDTFDQQYGLNDQTDPGGKIRAQFTAAQEMIRSKGPAYAAVVYPSLMQLAQHAVTGSITQGDRLAAQQAEQERLDQREQARTAKVEQQKAAEQAQEKREKEVKAGQDRAQKNVDTAAKDLKDANEEYEKAKHFRDSATEDEKKATPSLVNDVLYYAGKYQRAGKALDAAKADPALAAPATPAPAAAPNQAPAQSNEPTATGPNGQKIVYRNGAWSPLQ
jgi:hypothetical protein